MTESISATGAMPDGDGAVLPGPLMASVTAGESGPVITVWGEADLTSAGPLSALITAHVSGGTRQLTVDLSGLRFADLATIRTLVLAARTLQQRGGDMILLGPRRPVARVLALTGADEMFTILQTHGEPASEAGLLVATDRSEKIFLPEQTVVPARRLEPSIMGSRADRPGVRVPLRT